jgi:ATP-dependent DNA helicase RecQ
MDRRMPNTIDDLLPVIAKHWGYRTLRPLQAEAMQATLLGRDSLVVLPTGGGKSLCYQAPAVLRGGLTLVVSPLISLMKDQVDSLRQCGVPAVQIDSTLSGAERFAYGLDVQQGAVRLVFVSPERLASDEFCRLLQRSSVDAVAIDEAHCISHWGHDFRPEYRQLGRLKTRFPQASIHCYTATATEKVRADICQQLNLRNPLVLVGNFDRPNLIYRILPRFNLNQQILEVLERHPKEAGIIYCMRRDDVDTITAMLQAKGVRALGYHAGMEKDTRKRVQDAFAAEECDLIVATVAFGMGIDRSNVRFVLHAAMPKSVEHYQQETGRAGRDGLEAECALLYSGGDTATWKKVLQKSAQEKEVDPDFLPNALAHLEDLDRYCRGATCRHRALVEYFGQSYEVASCQACDICLGDTEIVPDAVVVAQKILSCVARVQERFGVTHVVGVLRGEKGERILQLGHDKLSTYGLLREHSKPTVRDWIFQLVGQGVLVQEGGDYPILKLNDGSWAVMRKQREVRLIQPMRREREELSRRSRVAAVSWEGVDRDLFEELRGLRRALAEARDLPPYIIMSDNTLRELARIRPSSLDKMRLIYGIGDRKLQEFGQQVLELMQDFCRARQLPMDVQVAPVEIAPVKAFATLSKTRALANDLFRQEASIDTVMQRTGLARSTIMQYLTEFIRSEKPAKIHAWVRPEMYERVAAVVQRTGGDRLKPFFIALEEKVPYDDIRLVVAHMRSG